VGTKARLGYVAEAVAREGIRLLPDWQEGVDPSASFGVLLESVRGAALTVPEGRPVGKEHLRRLASAAHAGVFGFVDAFLAKRFEEAFGMLEKLLAQGEGAARLWATLLGQWRLLTYLKDGELPQGVAPHPYVRQKLSRVLGLWTPEELRKGFAAFLWFDEQMKSGREPRAALVAALLEIAQASARRGA
jgi:DNA polymerase III gamma/tau subunit